MMGYVDSSTYSLQKDSELGIDLDKIQNDYPILTKEQEYELIKAAKKGNSQAEEVLIVSNFKLVVSIMNRIGKNYIGKVSKDDMFQSGTIGIGLALKNFDPKKGYRFSTHATPYIVREIYSCIRDNMSDFSIPRDRFVEYAKLSHLEEILTQKLYRTPDYKELAEAMTKETGEEWTEKRCFDLKKLFNVKLHLTNSSPTNSDIDYENDENGNGIAYDQSLVVSNSPTPESLVLNDLEDRTSEIYNYLYKVNPELADFWKLQKLQKKTEREIIEIMGITRGKKIYLERQLGEYLEMFKSTFLGQ